MSTAAAFLALDPPLRPITVEEYARMIEAGVFRSTDRAYLWNGRLAERMAPHRAHSLALMRLADALRSRLPATHHIEQEQPLAFRHAHSVPQPDLMILRGSFEDYPSNFPTTADVSLVAEVADTSLDRKDRGLVLSYAIEAVPVYWIVNLPDHCIEAYDELDSGTYRQKRTYLRDDHVPVLLDGQQVGTISVAEILP